MWCGTDTALEFIADRALDAGLERFLVENGHRLHVSESAFVSVGTGQGVIYNEGREIRLSLYNELEFALFAHNVDELLIAHGVEPDALQEPGYGRPKIFYGRKDPITRLMGHLWRSESAFCHSELPPARIGAAYWRPVTGEAGLYSAAWSVGMIKPALPVASPMALWMKSGKLHNFAPSLRTLEGPYSYYCLERDDGYRSRLVRVVDFKIVDFWTVEEIDDGFLDQIRSLLQLLALRARWAREAECEAGRKVRR